MAQAQRLSALKSWESPLRERRILQQQEILRDPEVKAKLAQSMREYWAARKVQMVHYKWVFKNGEWINLNASP